MNVHRSSRARRARFAVIGAAALGGALLPAAGLGASSALAAPTCAVTAGVVICTYTSGGTFVVPAGATSLTVTADGGRGAALNNFTGGLGGEAQATLTGSGLTGATLTVSVGAAGVANTTPGGSGGGGNGGNGLVAGGGGGGASSVAIGGNTLVVGAGGGGAAFINNGGNGGTSSSTTGQAGAGLLVGAGGGTTLAGGAAGVLSTLCSTAATAGTALQGGAGATNGLLCLGGGGGGGGYFGGGGGGSAALVLGGGGGGGSAYPAAAVTIASILVTPNTSDGNTNTGNGQVTISYPQISTTTTLTSTPNPSNPGQSVTFTATVGPTDGLGTVAFTDTTTSTVLCSAQTLSLVAGNYVATCTTSNLAAGANAISASYTSGSISYLGSTSTLYTQNVRAATTTTLTSSHNPSYPGQSVTLTATVGPTDGLGTVTFTNTTTSTVLCNAVALTLVGVNYQATCTISSLPVGSNAITAVYTGDVNYATSTGTLTQVVRKFPTSLSASIYFNSGQTFTVTATLTSLGSPVSGQSVSFYTGSHFLCSATTNGSGVARCVLTGSQTLLVEENNFTITADFSGGAAYNSSFATAHISMFP